MITPSFMHCVSSSLTESSCPIEIAFSSPTGMVESYLIRPVPGWADWSDFAQHHIHGIAPSELHEKGREPAWVANRMNAVLAARTVVTHSPAFDTRLIERLFDAAAVQPAFRLSNFYAALAGQASRERLVDAEEWARDHEPALPRASNGVMYLMSFWCRALLA